MPISTISQAGLDAPLSLTSPTLTTPTISSPTLSGNVAGTYTLAGTPTIRVASGTAGAPSLANTNDTLTGIFFPAANTIGLTTAGTERMRIDSSGNLLFNSGYGSAATAYGCRAWVNFNGTGTVAIRASGNVSSITDNGTGEYTVNFTTAMTDANYSTNVTSGPNNASVGGIFGEAACHSVILTSSIRIAFIVHTGSIVDTPYGFVSIFR